MSYRVTILPRAKRQMIEQAQWWAEHRSVDQAHRWLDGFERVFESLAQSPERCIVARESGVFDFVLRELHYGLRHKATHRAVFEVRGDEVVVHSVRHLAQSDLTAGDLE